MQVDDPALLDFLAEILVDIPARDFSVPSRRLFSEP